MTLALVPAGRAAPSAVLGAPWPGGGWVLPGVLQPGQQTAPLFQCPGGAEAEFDVARHLLHDGVLVAAQGVQDLRVLRALRGRD